MDHPRVSIIIPICDTGEHLRDCLESLSNQTLRDIEIICVATSSTNNCLPALEAWEEEERMEAEEELLEESEDASKE